MDIPPTRELRLIRRRTLLLIAGAFGLFGVVFGTWLVLLAELQVTLALSPATLGAALTAGLLASFPVMFFSGRAVDRWGAGCVIAGSVGVIGVAFAGTALAHTVWILLPFFLLFYSATAAYEVGINAAAISHEQTSGKRVISYFHATFSGFAALSALSVGALLAFGASPRLLYLTPAALAVCFGLAVWWSGIKLQRDIVPPLPAKASPRLCLTPTVLLLAAVTALAFLTEGEMGNWLTIYLRSVLDLPVLAGTSGFVTFHSAMFLGRLAGARAALQSGRWRVLQVAGATVAGGMLLALVTEQPLLVVFGVLLVGLGLSVVAPTAYSLVGDAAAEQTGAASSVLTTVGYGGYLFGPVLVGGIAQVAGLRLALATIVVAGSGIALLSSAQRSVGAGRSPAHSPPVSTSALSLLPAHSAMPPGLEAQGNGGAV